MKKIMIAFVFLFSFSSIGYGSWKFCISDLTLNHPYHRAWADAAPRIAKHFGAEMLFLNAEMDVNKQISDVQAMIQQRCDVIALVQLDNAALTPITKKALKKGIKVFATVSPIGIDGVGSLTLAGDEVFDKIADVVAHSIGKEGNVLFLAEEVTSVEGKARKDGFVNGMKRYPNINLLRWDNAEGDTVKGTNILESWLNKYDNIDAIGFASNGFALPGMQLLKNRKLDEIVINGYDGSEAALKAIESGEMLVDANISHAFWAWSITNYAYRLQKGYPVEAIEPYNIPLIMTRDTFENLQEKGLEIDFDWITPETARDFDKQAPNSLGKEITDKKFG